MLNFNIDIIYIFILAQLVKNAQLFENRQEISKLSCDFICKKKRGSKPTIMHLSDTKTAKSPGKITKKHPQNLFVVFLRFFPQRHIALEAR